MTFRWLSLFLCVWSGYRPKSFNARLCSISYWCPFALRLCWECWIPQVQSIWVPYNFLLRTQPCIVNNTSNQIVSQSFVHFFCFVVVYCVLQVNILKTYAVLYYEHSGVKDKFNCSTVSLWLMLQVSSCSQK